MYQALCILAAESDPKVFENRMAQFDKVWSSQEPDFVKYFSQNYQNRTGRIQLQIIECALVTYLYFLTLYQKNGQDVIVTSTMGIQTQTCM